MPTHPDAALVAALFRLVAAEGWRGVTAARLAQEAEVPLAEILGRFPSRLSLLRAFGDLVMDEVVHGTVPGQADPPRDRLFDVMMRGLDTMAPYKPGIRRLMAEMRTDPVLAAAMAPVFRSSMERMLQAAELDASGLSGTLRAAGLGLVWLRVVSVWATDTTEELGPTMAALDRALERAEQAARSFGLSGGDLAAAPAGDPPGAESTMA